jgi:hypothetical protein
VPGSSTATWVPATNLTNNGTNVTIADGTQGNGKILTSDAAGTASWSNPAAGQGIFVVRATTTQPLSSLAKKVVFGSVTSNPDNSYSTVDTAFIAPATGYYHFDVTITYSSASATALNNSPIFINIFRNTSIIKQHRDFLTTNTTGYSNHSISFSATAFLNAGDRVSVASGGSSLVQIDQNTYFSGYRIK